MAKKNLIKRLDKLASELAALSWGGMCARCGRVGNQTHHYFTRGAHAAVRWELDNLCWLCYGCHIGRVHRGGDVEMLRDNLIEKIGRERFDALKARAYVPKRWRVHELEEVFAMLSGIKKNFQKSGK